MPPSRPDVVGPVQASSGRGRPLLDEGASGSARCREERALLAEIAGLIDTPADLLGRTVADVMVRRPKTLPADATIAQVRAALLDDHVRVALLVEGDRLVAMMERTDLVAARAASPARTRAVLTGRTVAPGLAAGEARRLLLATGRRRLAVVDDEGDLLGLLCLKRRLTGFCSDADVDARATGPRHR